MIEGQVIRHRPIRRIVVLIVTALVLATALGSLAAVEPAQAAFPGANGKIAFESNRDGNHEIYVMAPIPEGANTNVPQRLTFNIATDSTPAVSPDGRKIAFASDRSGDFDIRIMNSDGSTQKRLTNNPGNETFPAWAVVQ